MSEFEQYAARYKEILDDSLGVCGADAEYFADYKARYTARVVGAGFTGKVLDFGCGIGLVSRSLKRYLPHAAMEGYDESKASVGLVDSEVSAQGLYTSDSRDLGTDYELIIVANVLHHVAPGDRRALCKELHVRLVPGGRLLAFEHNPLNPVTRWVVKHCPLDRGAILLPPRETIRHMRQAGFSSVRCAYVIFLPRVLTWVRPLERWLRWCPLGAQYVVECRKEHTGSVDDATA